MASPLRSLCDHRKPRGDFQSTNPFGWPRLVLALYGPDVFGNDVVHGYGCVALPIRAGSSTSTVAIYRSLFLSRVFPFDISLLLLGFTWLYFVLLRFFLHGLVLQGCTVVLPSFTGLQTAVVDAASRVDQLADGPPAGTGRRRRPGPQRRPSRYGIAICFCCPLFFKSRSLLTIIGPEFSAADRNARLRHRRLAVHHEGFSASGLRRWNPVEAVRNPMKTTPRPPDQRGLWNDPSNERTHGRKYNELDCVSDCRSIKLGKTRLNLRDAPKTWNLGMFHLNDTVSTPWKAASLENCYRLRS